MTIPPAESHRDELLSVFSCSAGFGCVVCRVLILQGKMSIDEIAVGGPGGLASPSHHYDDQRGTKSERNEDRGGGSVILGKREIVPPQDAKEVDGIGEPKKDQKDHREIFIRLHFSKRINLSIGQIGNEGNVLQMVWLRKNQGGDHQDQ